MRNAPQRPQAAARPRTPRRRLYFVCLAVLFVGFAVVATTYVRNADLRRLD